MEMSLQPLLFLYLSMGLITEIKIFDEINQIILIPKPYHFMIIFFTFHKYVCLFLNYIYIENYFPFLNLHQSIKENINVNLK